jgi:hypothetical protein
MGRLAGVETMPTNRPLESTTGLPDVPPLISSSASRNNVAVKMGRRSESGDFGFDPFSLVAQDLNRERTPVTRYCGGEWNGGCLVTPLLKSASTRNCWSSTAPRTARLDKASAATACTGNRAPRGVVTRSRHSVPRPFCLLPSSGYNA